MPLKIILFVLLLAPLAVACSSANPTSIPTAFAPPEDTPVPTVAPATVQATLTDTPVAAAASQVTQAPALPTTTGPAPEPTATASADAWMEIPVVPEQVSDRLGEIFQRGLEMGKDSHAFSKIGDCGSTPAWFLGDFDRGEAYYRLGEYTYLDGVIAAFQGSYDRTSLAAKSGFNASSIFAPLWSNRTYCQPDEAPLACEYRVHQPAFAFIMLGTNDVWHKEQFEPQMRKIIELSINEGIIPILATKADNEEGDHSLNATIVRLALEYEVPVWNYWRAVQALPNQGLQEDGAHLTWGPNRFDDPQVMARAWPVRNLTALQVLDIVWQAVNDRRP